ncbi:MAG: HAMP domain-containing histidine kinase [Oscillospiraceae bacterium]|nr:HAMP domain-containing histidine kinase [Oscillospiraceae bacterium]
MTYFSVIAIVLVLMNTYFLRSSRDMIFASKRAFVQHQAAVIALSLEDSVDTADSLTADDVLKIMTSMPDTANITNTVVTDAEGAIVYDPAMSGDGEDFPSGHIQRALEGFDVFNAKFQGGSFTSSAFTPVMKQGVVVGAVYVSDEDTERGTLLVDMQSTLRSISIIVAACSVAMVAFVIWSVMRRITSILKAIKYVREGEYNYHVNMRGRDELAMLGDEFNRLTDRIRETDEIRRRFVANASHELKTPLASIRLLSDSILQNEDIGRETVQEFITDIGDEAERLTRTTEKLMTLNRLDSHIPDENRDIDMREAVLDTIRLLKPLAQSRDISLEQELAEGCIVYAPDDTIHQIVFNLVENAIKYNKPGGKVTVRLESNQNTVILTVDDTGVGVPDEDMPHIFDRFYRVDKARSREAGGSGLGLSIVRDAARELNGKVTAARRAGGGMRFETRLALSVNEHLLADDMDF